MIPYPSFSRTSAKSGDKPKLPRRVQLVCPWCGGRFSLNYAEYRRTVRNGYRPCDSVKCAALYRKSRNKAPTTGKILATKEGAPA